jgi:hypothetical protein
MNRALKLLVEAIGAEAEPMAASAPATSGGATILTGELRKWRPVTLIFSGPRTSESARPNPFRDYRLNVTFSRGRKSTTVAGYYAADGDAAETGASAGNRWRAHFVPDREGEWRWRASFRTGKDVAVSDDPNRGRPVAFDGAAGTFTVGRSRAGEAASRARGMLRYVGERYLRYAETGEYFLKGGANSPENFLAYSGFDQTPPTHRYDAHARDFREGDPTWRNGRGRNIIGALNYLAGQGMNSVYFLTMNVNGDGKDVWPWIDPEERDRFDCSKLDQWEIVFSHMDRLGMMLHVVTQEQENDQLLDGGELGTRRKLYYRELIARFAHHQAITWNLGEETSNTDSQRQEFARYIDSLDPYGHLIAVHTFPDRKESVYTPLLGFEPVGGASLQTKRTHAETLHWIERSAGAGHPWVVSLDELNPSGSGVKPDAVDPDHDKVRKRHLWPHLMAGGAGVEWYFGYRFPHHDLNLEDWRSRARMWELTHHALTFFRDHLPFHEMRSCDALLSGTAGFCFAKPGSVYALYLPTGGEVVLDLGASPGRFEVRWYDPRNGGALQQGSRESISGPGSHGIGQPPAPAHLDWVALVRLRGVAPTGAGEAPGRG